MITQRGIQTTVTKAFNNGTKEGTKKTKQSGATKIACQMLEIDSNKKTAGHRPAVFPCPRPWDSQGAQAAERKARQWIMARETRFF